MADPPSPSHPLRISDAIYQTKSPQVPNARSQVSFPTVSGAVRCRKSPFLTAISWTESLTRVSWPKLSQKYLSWSFLSALQCRLDCHPGYVAHKTPIITCVNGQYQPQDRLWQLWQSQMTYVCHKDVKVVLGSLYIVFDYITIQPAAR